MIEIEKYFKPVLIPGFRKVFIIDGIKFPMRFIPKGKYRILLSYKDITTPTDVEVFYPFWIGETVVTIKQFYTILKKSYLDSCGDVPVTAISRSAIIDFLENLNMLFSKQSPLYLTRSSYFSSYSSLFSYSTVGNKTSDYLESDGWRLPTEVEWEYAARAGCKEELYGNINDIAWTLSNGGELKKVGLKKPNAWGLYDVLGNVRQIVYDCFLEKPNLNKENFFISTKGIRSVIRGSSFRAEANLTKLSRRTFYEVYSDVLTGFRIAKTYKIGDENV